MTKPKAVKAIKAFTSAVQQEILSSAEAEELINGVHAHFQRITEVSGDDLSIEHLAAIPAAKGKALGLNYAAKCLLDYKRTTKFLRAIVSGIQAAQKKHPGELIRVFYAGCGPYATLMTLSAPLFASDEVQFSLLEINEKSVASAKRLIDALGLSDHVVNFYTADATTFMVPEADSFHMLISETLDAVLFRECYVPILMNLLPQFRKEVMLIPENVVLSLSCLPGPEEGPGAREQEMGEVLNVRKAIASHSGPVPAQLPDKKVDLSLLNRGYTSRLLLDTRVHVREDIWLCRNESPLTLPLEMTIEQPLQKESLVFSYWMEPEVELKCRFE
ncbi:SAM-dependent methyltransferase [Neolewinella agarilytica]|nr:phytanoyl-CoA dioxygenase [Neolewinella agarilytica]